MSEIGESSATLKAHPRLRTHAVGATAVNTDRLAFPDNATDDKGGADIITSAVKASTAGGASTMAAKQLADYYEWMAESRETQQYWKPA